MNGWGTFFAAQVGAPAALAGLVFVGVSISLVAVLKYPHLLGRVLEAIAVLAGVLVISSLAPVSQPTRALGGEVFVVGLVGWLMGDVVQVRWWRLTPAEYRAKPGRWCWLCWARLRRCRFRWPVRCCWRARRERGSA